MRAAMADRSGTIECDGVRFGYELFGSGSPSILLMPTWTIVHSRFWKFQVPYLSRHYQVITYDGPGNGRAPRSTEPADYAVNAFVARAAAVMDTVEVERAVVVGFSDGGKMAAAFASEHPARVQGLVLVAPSLAVTPPAPDRASIAENFLKPYPAEATGWEKYNAAYWQDHYEDFLDFFFSQLFSETHSTKHHEDGVGWGRETNGSVLTAEALRTPDPDHLEVVSRIDAPTLIVHGSEDRLVPLAVGQRLVELTNGTLLQMNGTGHAPHMREPVRFNLAIREFVETLE